MKNLVIILDPAHGKDVAGKRSPDGVHREYLWSRNRITNLRKLLTSKGYEVYVTTEGENEPGLSKRKHFASLLKSKKRKLLISLHNDASGDGSKWNTASGVSVWTTKGESDSDICAEYFIGQFENDFKDVKVRKSGQGYLKKDFESNFTVLMGSGYMAVLIEWLFQDCKMDVERLENPGMNARFEDSLAKAIEIINNHFNQ